MTQRYAALCRAWRGAREKMGALPAEAITGDVHVVESAPLDGLFSRCSGVIYHVGARMTHAGLHWGRMVERIRVGPSPIPLSRLNVNILKATLRELRSKPLQDKPVALSKNIQMEGGAETAADLNEAA